MESPNTNDRTWDHSDDLSELIKALCNAQAEMGAVKKSAKNPFFKSKYADLSSIQQASAEALNKNGLVISQLTTTDGVVTILMHSSGQWLSGTLLVTPDKRPIKDREGNILDWQDAGPQQWGSALTYARRYALAAILNIPQEDDDGEGAMGRGAQRPATSQRPRAPKVLAHGKTDGKAEPKITAPRPKEDNESGLTKPFETAAEAQISGLRTCETLAALDIFFKNTATARERWAEAKRPDLRDKVEKSYQDRFEMLDTAAVSEE